MCTGTCPKDGIIIRFLSKHPRPAKHLRGGCRRDTIHISLRLATAFHRCIPFITLFDRVNEPISVDQADSWKKNGETRFRGEWDAHFPVIPIPIDLTSLWDVVHDRDTRRILTKTDGPKGQSVDRNMVLHNPEQFAVEQVSPEMTFPVGKKQGLFPDACHGYFLTPETASPRERSFQGSTAPPSRQGMPSPQTPSPRSPG